MTTVLWFPGKNTSPTITRKNSSANDPLSSSTLHYLFVDGKGKSLSKEFTTAAPISDCQPVVKDSRVVYYASNSNTLNFYSINSDNGKDWQKNLPYRRWQRNLEFQKRYPYDLRLRTTFYFHRGKPTIPGLFNKRLVYLLQRFLLESYQKPDQKGNNKARDHKYFRKGLCLSSWAERSGHPERGHKDRKRSFRLL